MSIKINPTGIVVQYEAGDSITVPVRLKASGDTAGCVWRPTKVGANVGVGPLIEQKDGPVLFEPIQEKDGSVLIEVTSPPNAGTHLVTLELSDGADRTANTVVRLVGVHQ